MGVKWFLVAVALIAAQECEKTALFQLKSRTQGLAEEEEKAEARSAVKQAVCYTTSYGRRRRRAGRRACVFPFTYEGVKLNRCSFLDERNAWCVTEERQDNLKFSEGGEGGFKWGYCQERCESDSPAEEELPGPSSLEELTTVEDVTAACLRRIDQCLWNKEKDEFTDEEVSHQLRCVTSVCMQSWSESECKEEVEDLAAKIDNKEISETSYTMSQFCKGIANWQFEGPHLLQRNLTDSLLQRKAASSHVDGGYLEETLSTKCL